MYTHIPSLLRVPSTHPLESRSPQRIKLRNLILNHLTTNEYSLLCRYCFVKTFIWISISFSIRIPGKQKCRYLATKTPIWEIGWDLYHCHGYEPGQSQSGHMLAVDMWELPFSGKSFYIFFRLLTNLYLDYIIQSKYTFLFIRAISFGSLSYYLV